MAFIEKILNNEEYPKDKLELIKKVILNRIKIDSGRVDENKIKISATINDIQKEHLYEYIEELIRDNVRNYEKHNLLISESYTILDE